MPKRARIALKVNDLAASQTFYVDRLGFDLAESVPAVDMAVVVDTDGDRILLAGPAVADVGSQLDEPRIVFKPGDTLDYIVEDIDVLLVSLQARGVSTLQQEGLDEGVRRLIITDPSNYKISYAQRVQRSPEELAAVYARGGDDLEAALAGLTEADLDLARAPGEWSIRQIVHHLVESDSLSLLNIKTALAQPGSTVIRNPYEQMIWAGTLGYQQRAIEPSLAFIQAVHRHITQLLPCVPAYWERFIFQKFASDEGEGSKVTVGQMLDGLSVHLAIHCAEIREIRRLHSR